MFRKVCGISLALLALMHLTSCVLDGSEEGVNAPIETQTEVVQDSDSQKNSALGLIFGLTAYDNLNINIGDNTDWRYILVPETGDLKIQLRLLQPDKIKGEWNILDAQGRDMESHIFRDGDDETSVSVSRGVYYFRAVAAEGASDYVVKAEFVSNASSKPVKETVVAQNDDDEDDEEEVKSDKTSKGGSSKTKTGSSSKSTASSAKAKGKIISFTEKSATEATLKIQFDVEGVKKGDEATPVSDVTVKMISCSGKVCNASAKGKSLNAVKKAEIVINLN